MTGRVILGRTSSAALKVAVLLLLGTSAVLADTLWTRTYDGPFGGDERVRAVLTDAYNNIVVVGSNVGEAGSGGYDFAVIKYSQVGGTMWTKRITGAGTSDDVAMGAALDPTTAAVNITGQSGAHPNNDILTVQLNPNGAEVWRATYDGTSHGNDVGTAIAVDAAGSVFVAGYVQNATADIVTIKYNWDGNRAWVKTYDGGGDDRATAVALGPGGSVYVTGTSVRSGHDDYATVKYSATGAEEWTAFYNGPNNVADQPVAVVVDDSGNAYVTGSSYTGTGPGSESRFATIKYDAAGTEQWVARTNRHSSPAALALGASALYVVGKSAGAQGDEDYATIAYDYGTGDTVWVRSDTGPTGSNDAAVGVAVGPDSSLWVGGSSNYDYVSVLYTPDGVSHWVETSGSPGDDQMAAIAVDNENQVIISGITWAGGGYDMLTVKFDTIGPGVAEPRTAMPPADFRFAIAPNPTPSGRAMLRCGPANEDEGLVTVSGVDGRIVLTRSVETGGSCRLDLSRLGVGVYVVRLETGGRSTAQKLVVGH